MRREIRSAVQQKQISLKLLFSMFDRDEDRFLSYKEFKLCLETYCPMLDLRNDQLVHDIFLKIRPHCANLVNFHEFATFIEEER